MVYRKLSVRVLSLLIVSISCICCHKKDSLPVHGTFTWNVSNTSFKADSFATAQKGTNMAGQSIIEIWGVSSTQNTLQINLSPIKNGPATYTAGISQLANSNVVTLTSSGQNYSADNYNGSAATVTIVVTEQTDKEIKGTFNGNVSSSTGNLLPINGSFDMNF